MSDMNVYDQGMKDASSGVVVGDNPYSEDDKEKHWSWMAGWLDVMNYKKEKDVSIDLNELVENLTEWHIHQVEQLQSVVDNRDVDIILGVKEQITFAADSDVAKGIRYGVSIALDLLGTLPFTVTPIICPVCKKQTDQDELDIFGGFCEECNTKRNKQ